MLRFLIFATIAIAMSAQAQIPEIARRIPPKGIEIPAGMKSGLIESLTELQSAYAELEHVHAADVGVLLKGVEFALMNGEFFKAREFETAKSHLELAKKRLAPLQTAERGVLDERGRLVRGYVSPIDDSVQPYGLEIPKELDLTKPVPLLVWLHGRGDKVTDLHFIERCLTKSQALGGKVAGQKECIILHPFGRQCIGWKHSGEQDIFDAIADVQSRYQIDPDRIMLAGFSMGGAGAWHVGAHYADRFSAVHAGAGFAETAKYNKLVPESYPVWYEQTLWGVYDVPGYARNLLNLPVVAYSGEVDKQIQAADVMAEVLKGHGLELDHRIGPGMGHKYHDDSVAPIFEKLLAAKRSAEPNVVEFQTQTLRYNRLYWVEVLALQKHWEDTRVSAKETNEGYEVSTTNVAALVLRRAIPSGTKVRIDGQELVTKAKKTYMHFVQIDGVWKQAYLDPDLRKAHGLQGPIEDAFMDPFLVVLPDEKSDNERFQAWIDFETKHFAKRWTELFRGNLRIKRAGEVTAEDVENFNLICFGEAKTNAVIGAVISKLPLIWNAQKLELGGKSYAAANHIPALIYPNPLNGKRYVVLNSGVTFREGHDKTNSQQNPKLPDWAVINLDQLPNDLTAGKIVDANFFDENWR